MTMQERPRSSADARGPRGFESCSRTRGLKNDPGIAIRMARLCLRTAKVVIKDTPPVAGLTKHNSPMAAARELRRVLRGDRGRTLSADAIGWRTSLQRWTTHPRQ